MTEFEKDCMAYHGKILTGKYKHFCPDWDDMPIDDTCFEYQFCTCEKK